LPLDINPNSNFGVRIFPDDKEPNDPKNRRKIRIRARYGLVVPNVDIYFQAWDLDDPSIADTDTSGNDNNDEVKGQFSIPSGATGCQILSTGIVPKIKCPTNAQGEAVVEFTVTRQPGDNFAFTASQNSYSETDLSVVGTNIFDSSNQQITNICTTQAVCRSEMLTIWRRLHIEVDSMGIVTGNKVTGSFPYTKKIPNTDTLIVVDIDSQYAPLEIDRFVGGRLVINGGENRRYKIISNGASTLTLKPQHGNASIAVAGETFSLYDDDDYNNLDGINVKGDMGENITNPSYMFEALSPTSDNPDDNILAPAYIKPVYDAPDTRDDNNFRLNLPTNSTSDIRLFFDKWDSSAHNTDREYWSVYILGSYQPKKNEDGDNLDTITKGIVDEITDQSNSSIEGSGALIFLEMHRIRELPTFTTSKLNPKGLQVTVAHEIGHLFGRQHGEGEIMGPTLNNGTPVSNRFSASSLTEMRKMKHP
jgi:hypothetical protein